MSGNRSVEIRCSACRNATLLVRESRYEGLSKVGEDLKCSGCGYVYTSEEEVPFIHSQPISVFSDSDRSAAVQVFEEHEADRICRHCVHYVINPFLQWCGNHKKEVEATDTCPQFERKPKAESASEKTEPSGPPAF